MDDFTMIIAIMQQGYNVSMHKSDSENDEWKYYHEVQSSIAIDIYEAVYQTLTL